MKQYFGEKYGKYADVAGLCKVVSIRKIGTPGLKSYPGRYVGVADNPPEDFDFKERLEELNEELEMLNTEASKLEDQIRDNALKLIEGTRVMDFTHELLETSAMKSEALFSVVLLDRNYTNPTIATKVYPSSCQRISLMEKCRLMISLELAVRMFLAFNST